jgi:hypothetical protein
VEQPEVLPWADAPWRAWNELSSERQHTVSGYAAPMGAMMLASKPEPIPWSAVLAWCERTGCDDDERTEFIQPLIAALDREYIEHCRRQQTKGKLDAPDDKLSRWDRMDAQRR